MTSSAGSLIELAVDTEVAIGAVGVIFVIGAGVLDTKVGKDEEYRLIRIDSSPSLISISAISDS